MRKKKKENFVGCVVLERKALTQKQKQSKIKKKNKKPGNVQRQLNAKLQSTSAERDNGKPFIILFLIAFGPLPLQSLWTTGKVCCVCSTEISRGMRKSNICIREEAQPYSSAFVCQPMKDKKNRSTWRYIVCYVLFIYLCTFVYNWLCIVIRFVYLIYQWWATALTYHDMQR